MVKSGFPPRQGAVTDVAKLLPDDLRQDIDRRLSRSRNDTGVEVAVVTIESIRDYRGTPNGSIEAFARGLFDAYGIGTRNNNTGVLLLSRAATARRASSRCRLRIVPRPRRRAHRGQHGSLLP